MKHFFSGLIIGLFLLGLFGVSKYTVDHLSKNTIYSIGYSVILLSIWFSLSTIIISSITFVMSDTKNE